jgi:hypothetical protein
MDITQINIVWFLGGVIVALCVLAFGSLPAAYRNGVTDGYGYSREPRNPGYAKAGRYLQASMSHRWPVSEPAEKSTVKLPASFYMDEMRQLRISVDNEPAFRLSAADTLGLQQYLTRKLAETDNK